MRAEKYQSLVCSADFWVSPRRVGIDAPFQHAARDVEGARNDPVTLAFMIGAQVNDERPSLRRIKRVARFESRNPPPCTVKQLVHRDSPDVPSHSHSWSLSIWYRSSGL